MPRHRMNIRWNTRKTVLLAGITLLVLAVAVGGQLGRPSAPGGSATIARPIAKPVSPATTAPPVVPPPGAVGAPAALAELAAGGAIVSLDSAGHVVSVTAPPAAKLPAAGADAFTRRYAAALGVPNGSTLRQTTTLGLSQNGDKVVRYQQEFGGVPVLGGEIVVSTDSRGRVLGANAETVSIAPKTTKALVDAGAATQAGVARAATLAGREVSELRRRRRCGSSTPR